jgi:2-dehydropantoate 2-reductase
MTNQKPQRIALIGPGAIGCCLGAALLQQGHDVVVASRTPFDRLQVIDGDTTHDHPVRCARSPEDLREMDLVVLATKAHQTQGAVPWLLTALEAGAPVLMAQNGVDHRERLQQALADATAGAARNAPVVPAVVYLPARREAPGRAVLEGRAALSLPADSAGEQFAAAFADSFVQINLVQDWLSAAWGKLLMNAASGAITALLGRPIDVLRDPGAAALARALMTEVMQVGRAEGAVFPDDMAERLVAGMVKAAGHHVPSITQDRMAGLPTEWQARNEVVVRLAQRHGIAVPLNEALTTLLRLGEPEA